MSRTHAVLKSTYILAHTQDGGGGLTLHKQEYNAILVLLNLKLAKTLISVAQIQVLTACPQVHQNMHGVVNTQSEHGV